MESNCCVVASVPEVAIRCVAAVGPIETSLPIRRGAQALGVHLHHALGDELDHLAQQIGAGSTKTHDDRPLRGTAAGQQLSRTPRPET